jgi:hypothetical protein
VLEQNYAPVSSLLFQVPVFNHAYGIRTKLEKLHSQYKKMQVFWDVMLCAVSSGLQNLSIFVFRDKHFHSHVISGFHCEADI